MKRPRNMAEKALMLGKAHEALEKALELLIGCDLNEAEVEIHILSVEDAINSELMTLSNEKNLKCIGEEHGPD